MPTSSNDKPKELKVTDKRIFTADGEIRDEFKEEIRPAEPQAASAAAPQPEAPPPQAPPKAAEKPQQPPREERRRTMADRAQNPGTAFTDFVEPLIAQAYMFLGMLRDPRQPKPTVDVAGARQMIEIITMLKEKTDGNLTPDEDDFLATHLGELKLAFVQRTKSI